MKTILPLEKTYNLLILILFISFTFFVPIGQAQSLVGHWQMDEGSGTTLVDASTYGNDGTIVNGPTWVSGVINLALNLNESVTNQYATVPDAGSLDITSAITLACWVKPNVTGTQYLIKKAFTDPTQPSPVHIDGYELSLSSSGAVFVRFNQLTSGDTYKLTSSVIVPADGNTWTHIATTYDGTTMRLYINGVLDVSMSGPTAIIANNELLGIGAQAGSSGNRLSGAIDDARVYDYALDAATIQGLATVLPTAPILRSPADGTTDLTIPVTLKFYAAASATSYQLQISTDPGFGSTIYDQSGITNLTNLITGLPENTQLYWQVRATGNAGTGPWSEVWGFTTSVALPSILGTGAGFALNLNGSNYVSIPDDNILDPGTAITLEAWIKPGAVTTQRIVCKGNSSGYDLFMASDGTLSFRINFNNTYRVYGTTVASIGNWIHVAGTYDGSTIRLYVNGEQEGGDVTGTTISGNGADFTIGAQSNGSNRYTGVVDEVRIWNVVRTQTDIRNNMCQKLSGSESGLIGYWRFDETSGDSYSDETSNNFTLTGQNSAGSEHVWSGANIGDVSVTDYDAAGGYSATNTNGDGDNLTATTTSGTITGIQVYRVNSNSMSAISTIPGTWTSVDPLRYWGVKVIGSSTPTYTVVYNYNGHPNLGTESDLRLGKRSNLSDANWVDAGATLDDVAKTLTVTGQTGTEYTLGSLTSPLPVELNSFSASISENSIKLSWRTETEVANYGFEVQRSVETNNWNKIGFVEGAGNSNSPKDYSFVDNNITAGKYSYRLKQIDNDGKFSFSKTVEVNFGEPGEYTLSQNYPNPFNPVTTIKFSIPLSGNVKLTVYNILGEKIAELINGYKDAGVHTINFNATQFNSGLYLYKLESNGFIQTRKMLLIK